MNIFFKNDVEFLDMEEITKEKYFSKEWKFIKNYPKGYIIGEFNDRIDTRSSITHFEGTKF